MVKIGFYQHDVAFADKATNLARVRDRLAQAEFDLLLLPELFSTGCLFTSRQQARALAEPVPGGETTQTLIEIAKACDGHLVAGLVETDGERIYNTAVVVGPEGYIGKHRKVHLSECGEGHFTPGTRFEAFDMLGIRVGILLCYDIWFDDGLKALKKQGVAVVLNPANFCGEDSLDVITAQAGKGQVTTVATNRLGMDHETGTGVSFIGNSLIVSPQGEVLTQAADQEVLTVLELGL